MVMDGRWVRYGGEAAAALRDAIGAAKGAEPLAPVTVIVPSNQVGVSLRRQLASGRIGPVCGAGPGLVAVTFLTPYRLAELLGAPTLAGSGRRPVSTPVLTAAVRRSLADAPGVFAPVAEHPATEAALVASYRELRDVSRGALDAVAAQGERAAHVVRLYRATRERLHASWYDEEDLMAAASAALAAPGAAADLGRSIVFLPQGLSRHAAELLRTLGAHGSVTILAGATGHERADAEVATGVARLGAALGPPPAAADLAAVVSVDRTRIVTTSDADEEVREAIRAIVEAVRGGTPLDRIAVLHGTAEPYGRLVREHLGAAGIACNGPAEVSLAERLPGRVLLGVLALPIGGFRRQDVFAWLTSAPIRAGSRLAPTTAWERISREAGVVRGREDWDGRLARWAERADEEATEIERDPEGSSSRAERKRADARRARALRTFVLELVERLQRAAAADRTWTAWVGWARRLFVDTLGGPHHRAGWPDAERRAAERVELALDRLQALDGVEGPVGIDVFTRTLAIELESDVSRIGRFGEGVLVGSVAVGVGVDLDRLILVGLAEGSFPGTVRDDSLLPDAEREAAGGELALRSGHVDRLHRQFLATLAGAERHLLGVPRGDLRRSSERVPSRWVLDVASTLAGERWWSAELGAATDVPWVDKVASFDAGLRQAPRPATDQEHRLRQLLAAPTRPLADVAAGVDATLAHGVDLLEHRRSRAFTRFDGNLAGLAVPSPVERGASATTLEHWAKCPHAYFVQHVLRVEPLEQPEEQLVITPLDRGSLVHEVLERFVLEVLARPESEQPAPTDRWTPEDADRLEAIADEVGAEYERRGLTGLPIFWRRDRRQIAAELRLFLTVDDQVREIGGRRPAAAELAFGLRQAPAVPFPLPDGRSVPMRGKADRVDLGEDGTIHVLDYKTGSATSFKGLSAEDPHQSGTRLQLAIYGLAARLALGLPDAPVDARYWFVSKKGGFAFAGYRVTDDVLDRVSQAMAAIVGGIERGIFAANPGPPTTSPWIACPFCDPDGLGTTELRSQWERKIADPGLAAYLELHDPVGADGDPAEVVA